MPSLDLGSVVGPPGEQGATGAQGIRGEQGLPGPNQVTNSTATPLTGVLTGNGSVVGVASVDAAPTADSTGFAQSGGTYQAIKGKVPVYGLGKNLLDNWYFMGEGSQLGDGIFPINQRGQTNYTLSPGVYTLDRWRAYKYSGSATVNLTSNGLEYSGDNCAFQQKIKVSVSELLGKVVTLSAIIDGMLHSETVTMPTTFQSSSNIIDKTFAGGNVSLVSRPAPAGWANAYYVALGTSTNTAKVIKAVKLEFGSQQTLCHNEGTDSNPVWVLNEIPDYEEELIKCQTSMADSSDDYTNKSLATEQQLTGDYVETGTTASRAYAVGKYFCWNGLLYRVTSAITSSGQPLNPGSNCTAMTAGGLNELFTRLKITGTQITVTFNSSGYVDITSTNLNIGSGVSFYLLSVSGVEGDWDKSHIYGPVLGNTTWRIKGTASATQNLFVSYLANY